MEKIKIIVVDDSETFRDGITFFLEQVLSYEVVGCASNGKEFLLQKEKYIAADIILMDIQMPEIDGIETAKRFLWYNSLMNVIAITSFRDIAYLRELIGAGFKGCVFKDKIFEDLETAVQYVLKGKLYFPDNIKIQ